MADVAPARRLRGSALKRSRDTLGLSQAEMATALGVSLRTYHGWEAENRDVPLIADPAVRGILASARQGEE